MIDFLIAFSSFMALFLSGLTYSRSSETLKNKAFAVLSLAVSIWAFPFILYDNPVVMDSLFWIRVIYVCVIFMVGSLYFFCFAFPYNERPPKWTLVAYFALNCALLYLLFGTQSFVAGVDRSFSGPETRLGLGYIMVVPAWISFIFYGLFTLIKKYLKASGTVRLQLLYIFLGLGIFFMSAIIFDAIVPALFQTTALFSLSAAFSLFFVGLSAYAIVRHRLLDIRLLSHRVITYLITVMLATFILAAIAIPFRIIQHIPVNGGLVIVLVVAASIFLLIEGYIHQLAEYIAGHFLFQTVYDYKRALLELSLNLSNYLDLHKLTEVIATSLEKTMRLTRICILVRDFSDNYYRAWQCLNFNQDNCLLLVHQIPIVSYLEGTGQILIRDELESLISENNDQIIKRALEQTKVAMEQATSEVVIPILSKGVMVGVILLGHKVSGDAFTVQDISLLRTVATQASVAFENARLYSEVSDLNKNLEKRIEAATHDLAAANKQLTQLDQLKDDFVSIASHELRTPMTAIRSYSWMALNKSDIKLSPKIKKYLERVLLSTERLINLVNDMLNISRIESGRVAVNPKSFAIDSLVKDVLEEVAPKLQEKDIQVSVVSHQAGLAEVFADPDKVHQVLLNLLGNALKFTPAGGKITVSFLAEGQFIDINITDNGVGIARENLPRLFKKFGRLDNSYEAAATMGGTGLGLYISKSLVELMQGKIWVTSEGLGKGATFSFSLPVASAQTLSHAKDYSVVPIGEAKSLEPVTL